MKLSNTTYDTLKWVTTIVLPALATLYLTLATIWGLRYGSEIAATITAFVTCLGIMLQISSAKYNAEASPPNEDEAA